MKAKSIDTSRDAPTVGVHTKTRAGLNVLFLTPWYPTTDSPVAGVFVRECARAVSLYHNVVVVHDAGIDPNQRRAWRLEQETNGDLTAGIPTYRFWHRRSPVPKTSYILYLWSVWRACCRLARQGFRPDIIHAHVYGVGVPAVLAARLRRIPVVITEHFTGFPRRLLSRREVRSARWAFRRADVVMPVSESLLRAIEAYDIKANFRVVPNVADTHIFHHRPHSLPNAGPKRLLCVALLDEKKGIRYLLEAVAKLPPQAGPWRLDIVGDGPERQPLQAKAQELGISDRVTFQGVRPKSEVAEFMGAADLFVLPSLWENLPCVIAEAMTTGLPVLSTLVGGIPEMVDDMVGMLVPPGDADALSAALASMLENLDRYDRAAIAWRANIYSPESVANVLHSIYEECLRK